MYWKLREALRERRAPVIVQRWRAIIFYKIVMIQAALGGLVPRRQANKKHLLLLVWSMPPDVNGGVYRPTALLKYGIRTGEWCFSLLTGPEPVIVSQAGEYLKKQFPPEVSIKRISPYPLNSKSLPFPDVDGGIMNALNTFAEGRRLYRGNPPTVIMASGPKFHNFIAATLLARFFDAKLVLEYRDEWSQCPFDFVIKFAKDVQWENWCLSKADLVVFTTFSQLQHQVNQFPQLDANKCIVVPNGWDANDFIDKKVLSPLPKTDDPNKTFVLAFLGYFGAIGHVDKFLNVLEAMLKEDADLRNHFKLMLVGDKTTLALAQLKEFAFQDIIELIDQIPKLEACRMMASSDALLLINPPSISRYIPGKLYDYLASKTPVLVYGEGGEIGEIVKKLNAGIVVPDGDLVALRHALQDIRKFKRVTNQEVDDWLKTRTRETLSYEVMDALSGLINSDTSRKDQAINGESQQI